MIFFFHHYELPALLEQIRHQQQQQQQQQQMPQHPDQQVANGLPGNNAQPDEESDQSGSDQSASTGAEERHVGDLVTADADNTRDQLSSVDRTEQGQSAADVTEHQLYMSGNVGSIVNNTLRESTAATSPMLASTSDEDGHRHYFCAADTEEARVQSDVLLLPSHNVPIDTEDFGRSASPLVGSSMELRRRCPVSDSTSLCSSDEAIANHQDHCALFTDLPSSGPVMTATGSSLADVLHDGSNVPSTSPSSTD